MKYGYFDDNKCEYVICEPHTPLPWINYLGTDKFFSLVSQTGGGYSFYKDAKLRRLTRYRYNDVPRDGGGRMYYILDGDSMFSPAYKPAATKVDTFRCRHGLGYTVYEVKKAGLATKLTCMVPLGESCEVNQLELKNQTNERKEIQVFSAVEWCLWDALDDALNYQRNYSTGEVEVEGSVLYHKTEYRERRNHYAFFSVNHEVEGFDTSREAFLGLEGSFQYPKTVKDRKSSNSMANGWSPIASHNVRFILEPGESQTLIFVLGYEELEESKKWSEKNVINKEPAHKTIEKFAYSECVSNELEKLKEYWNALLSNFSLQSTEKELDRMVNVWNQYQNVVTFNLSRSASYYESGIGRGMGFRDSCQDLLGIVHMVPQRSRQRILDIAATQMEDGSAWHQYQPLTKKGNADIGSGFNDDPLWLVAAVSAYVRETGDDSILFEPVCFNSKPSTEKKLMEHLKRSVHYTMNRLGPHGLPLIGRADWNDCLNLNCFSREPGESFQTCDNRDTGIAESVLIAAMFILYGEEYASLCERYKKASGWIEQGEADEIRKAVAQMKCAVETHGWDGNWFLRAYDSNGAKVGSHTCQEGKIFIEPQGFCIMAGIGLDDTHARQALDHVKKHLDTSYGTCLLWPCYTSYQLELGEITSYPPGYKENGGIFCHSNPWICIANTAVNDGNAAFENYRRISPAYTEEQSDMKKTEPYVYCQMIAGKEAPTHGEGKNSWLTGTAAWNYVAVTQHILGIRPGYDGLEITPCLPDELDEVKISRIFRGTKYNITLKRGKESGMWVDHTKIEGNKVPLKTKETEVTYVFVS